MRKLMFVELILIPFSRASLDPFARSRCTSCSGRVVHLRRGITPFRTFALRGAGWVRTYVHPGVAGGRRERAVECFLSGQYRIRETERWAFGIDSHSRDVTRREARRREGDDVAGTLRAMYSSLLSMALPVSLVPPRRCAMRETTCSR